MKLGEISDAIPKLADGSIDCELVARRMYVMGVRRGEMLMRALVDEVRVAERERCCEIADSIDSGRGNEKEIIKAIRNLGDE